MGTGRSYRAHRGDFARITSASGRHPVYSCRAPRVPRRNPARRRRRRRSSSPACMLARRGSRGRAGAVWRGRWSRPSTRHNGRRRISPRPRPPSTTSSSHARRPTCGRPRPTSPAHAPTPTASGATCGRRFPSPGGPWTTSATCSTRSTRPPRSPEIGVQIYPMVSGRSAQLVQGDRIDLATLKYVATRTTSLGPHLRRGSGRPRTVKGSTPVVGDSIRRATTTALDYLQPLQESFHKNAPLLQVTALDRGRRRTAYLPSRHAEPVRAALLRRGDAVVHHACTSTRGC